MMLPWKAEIEHAIIKCSTKLSFETVFDLGWLLVERSVWNELKISVQLLPCKHSHCAFDLPLHLTYFLAAWQKHSLVDSEPELDFLIFLTSDKMEWLWKQ